MTTARFGQVLTAMVTPFTPEGAVDDAAVVSLVEYLLSHGSDGLIVCGTTGESPTLTHEEKLHLFRLVKQTVKGRGAVIGGTSSYDTAASVSLTREVAEIGLDAALLVVPPYSKPSQEGLYRHFKAIAHAVPNLPCLLYNVPGRTAQNLDTTTTLRLAHDVSNVVATKEAGGNLIQCAEIFAGKPTDFQIYSGDDGLTLPILSVGGVGVISVSAHLVGDDMKAMHTAFFAGDFAEASRLNAKMLPIVRALFQPTTPSPAPLKAALNGLGISVGGLRLPLVEANDKETAIVRAALSDYGLRPFAQS